MLKILKFDDLPIRMISAIVMIFIAGLCILLGNFFYNLLLLFLAVVLFFEVCKLLNPKIENTVLIMQLIVTVLTLTLILFVDFFIGYFLLFIPAIFLSIICKLNRLLSFCTGVLLILSLITYFEVKIYFGTFVVFWVISCVVATDIAGYFVGRLFGGPKIWLLISPNKTWSGVFGGWVLASIVGFIFLISFNLSPIVIFMSFIISLFSQMGDFYESWLKRRAKKKDSSQLIPGHGGFLDRFDGFIGGAIGLKICLLFFNSVVVTF